MIRLDASEIWTAAASRVVLDVRSPGEFDAGHIPGALSFPLFSDDERAIVGTTYKQEGSHQALQKGLDIVGPKMSTLLRQAHQLAQDKKVLVHCWRGGKRSESVGWLLGISGYDVQVLDGGYKAYRQYLHRQLDTLPLKWLVLGGKTGSGKTAILRKLAELGEQVIDLEGLACHKGSAFGWIGEAPQPTTEQFENQLFEWIRKLDFDRRIWIENESRKIGAVYLPETLWRSMKSAPLINLSVPIEGRLQHLVASYATTRREDLELSFRKIAKKLGEKTGPAMEALACGDYSTAAAIALHYYDKTYQYGWENNPAPVKRDLQSPTIDPDFNARLLRDFIDHSPL